MSKPLNEMNIPENQPISVMASSFSEQPRKSMRLGRLYGNSTGLLLASIAKDYPGLLLVVTADSTHAAQMENELAFFSQGLDLNILHFPDWETLPYDLFSPHPDIVSTRIETLYQLPSIRRGILIVPIATLLQRLPPKDYIQSRSLILCKGDIFHPQAMRNQLEHAGYYCVSQVMEHGEFALRGSLMDIFPMGSQVPFRIDLFDEEIESVRTFDPETQRTIAQVDEIRLLPAREFPTDENGITQFRKNYRSHMEGDPQKSLIYREVSQARIPNGIEYYLPLFFEYTDTLFAYLPKETLLVDWIDTDPAADKFWHQLQDRYEQRRHNLERPILPPQLLYLDTVELRGATKIFPNYQLQAHEFPQGNNSETGSYNFATSAPPVLLLQNRSAQPLALLQSFVSTFKGKILFVAESTGRREMILDLLRDIGVRPKVFSHWQQFSNGVEKIGITVAQLDQGALIENPLICIITETQLFGERAKQSRRKRKPKTDPINIINDLTDLHLGAPVVHEEHGVGRYLGLQKLEIGENSTEFLTLEYAGGDKLYVPVACLHLISRYTGTSPENAPLHKLGSDQWQRVKRKAAERARDVAVELLDIYARRAARIGFNYHYDVHEYQAFSSTFPFDETEDQASAIEAVIADMRASRPMDRVICGDVGFGKTEVAMRAAFIAVQSGKQVAVLVPTTLLAQQHYQNFLDRFADWPVRIAVLSRFKSQKQQKEAIDEIKRGTIDIVIGTHKLLQPDIQFKDLGLAIIDEEHRFGVRQKEKVKALRAEVDVLTLTATPIPRTLNMSLSGLRDLSLITTPPAERVAIKTFISQWDNALLLEALQRELKRGGQIYWLHNEVSSIERMAKTIEALVPEAAVEIAHGQMREAQLEQVMLDFYHRRFNVLICTTIIESGIDVPNANTIIINRADKLGLAQLHQIRGRVGRSHHRAYAYLLIPDRQSITPDALKRLQAIESLEDLGAGFMLATHDLEIRGAGELLGDEQSGQIQEIGFSLYTELLERAVTALKSGKQPELDQPLAHGPEIDLRLPTLLPDDYLPDVHTRLTMYKRIANAADKEALRDIQVEMIDRFGLLPESAKALIRVTELKLQAMHLGVKKIDATTSSGRIVFSSSPNINTSKLIELIQKQPNQFKLEGQEKLRFYHDMEHIETRFARVTELLDWLTPPLARLDQPASSNQ